MNMQENQTKVLSNIQEDPIDIMALVKTVWTDRKLVLKFACISFIIGCIG